MIHQYKLHGLPIVLDTCSGSVHVVDDIAYDIIALYEQQSKEDILNAMLEKYGGQEGVTAEEIAECYDQVTELKDQGRLFTPDTFAPMAGQLKQKTAGVVKALCLHVAHTCNLNCSYCFASQGKYHGERAIMSFEVGKQALDFLVANSGTRQQELPLHPHHQRRADRRRCDRLRQPGMQQCGLVPGRAQRGA